MLNPRLRLGYLLASLIFMSQYLWLLNHGFDEVWALRLIAGPIIAGLAAYMLSYVPEYFWGPRIWNFWQPLDNWIMRPGITTCFIILTALLVYIYCAGGHLYSTDDDFRLRATKAILENGNVILYMHDDGYPVHCKYGITHLIMAIPLYLAGKGFYSIIPTGFDWATIFTTSLMQFTSAAACGIMFLTCLQLGYSRWVSLATALIMAFATITWPYSKHYFTEPLTATLMLASLWQLLRFKNRQKASGLLFSGLLLGLAGLNSPQVFMLVVPVMGIYVLYLLYPRPDGRCQNWSQFTVLLLFYCIPLGLCLLAQLGYNYLRYDTPFATGYAGDRGYPSLIYDGSPGWSLAWWVGLEGYLFTPGKSVFLYSPVLVLSAVALNQFYKRNRHEAVLLIFIALLWMIFYTKWWAWHGDAAWGPRYTVPLTMLWFIPLAEAISWWPRRGWGFRLTVIGLVMFGVVVQMAGIAIPFGDYFAQEVNPNSYEEQYLLHYVPHFSPILGHWEMILKGARLDFLWLGRPFGSMIMMIAVVLLNILLGAAVSCRKRASQ